MIGESLYDYSENGPKDNLFCKACGTEMTITNLGIAAYDGGTGEAIHHVQFRCPSKKSRFDRHAHQVYKMYTRELGRYLS